MGLVEDLTEVTSEVVRLETAEGTMVEVGV